MIFHQLHNGTQNLNGALWCVFITSHEVVLRINANRQKEKKKKEKNILWKGERGKALTLVGEEGTVVGDRAKGPCESTW